MTTTTLGAMMVTTTPARTASCENMLTSAVTPIIMIICSSYGVGWRPSKNRIIVTARIVIVQNIGTEMVQN